MQVTMDVGRFNPEAEKATPYRQEYSLEVEAKLLPAARGLVMSLSNCAEVILA